MGDSHGLCGTAVRHDDTGRRVALGATARSIGDDTADSYRRRRDEYDGHQPDDHRRTRCYRCMHHLMHTRRRTTVVTMCGSRRRRHSSQSSRAPSPSGASFKTRGPKPSTTATQKRASRNGKSPKRSKSCSTMCTLTPRSTPPSSGMTLTKPAIRWPLYCAPLLHVAVTLHVETGGRTGAASGLNTIRDRGVSSLDPAASRRDEAKGA